MAFLQHPNNSVLSKTPHIWAVSLLCLVFLCNGPVHCRVAASSGFSFGGTSTLTGYYSSQRALGQGIPGEYLSWQMRGQLELFHLPVSISSLLSTQQDSRRQSMNHLSVRLDTRALARVMDASGRMRWLRGVETFELGRTHPQYARMSLYGVRVDGVNAAVRLRALHLALVYGNSQRPVQRGLYLEQQYRQRMLYARLGAGYTDRTFIAVSFLHARDDDKSIKPSSRLYHWEADTLVHHLDTLFVAAGSAAVFRKPGQVLIPGIEWGSRLFKGKLAMGGELSGMLRTANTSGQHIRIDAIPEWVDRIHPVALSTSISYAFALNANLQLPATRIQASYRHIEPGYYSPGTAFLRQDQRMISLRGSQALFDRKLSIQPHYRRMNDNLMGQNKATTHTTIWGVSANWRHANWPWISLSVSPHLQKRDDPLHPTRNKAYIMSLSAGKNFVLQDHLHTHTSLSWSHQRTDIDYGGNLRKFTGNNISLQQSLQLPVPLRLMVSGGLYLLDDELKTTTSYQLMLQGNYHVSPRWMVSGGGRHFNQGGERKRWSLRLETSCDFGPYGRLQLLFEPVYYRDILGPEREYDQYVLRLQLINSW